MIRFSFTITLLYCLFTNVVAQNNAITTKLLSSEPNEIYGVDYPSVFEYDNQNRVSRVIQTDNYGQTTEISASYGDNTITVSNSRERYDFTLQDGRITKSEQTRHGRSYVDQIYTYTYDNNGKIIHIYREVPPETDRNTAYDLTWEDGLLTKCVATKTKDGTKTNITYTYTDIEDRTLANFFCSPFEHITNYETGESRAMPLMDCHGFYGWQSTRLPKTITKTSSGKKSEYAFNYERDSYGRVTTISYNYNNKRTITTTLHWDGSSTQPTTDLPATDNNDIDFGKGGDINDNTNLDGNIVGNVYYNIGSGNGGYDSTEGCIYVSQPTDESYVDGKDIFGEEFKKHFTGMAFKVAAGSGSIKLKAETTGGMTLKVKVGENTPYEMILSGKLDISFPYNVTKPTYIYIYASSMTSSTSKRASAPTSALKIFSLSWQDTTGIENVNANSSNEDKVFFTLDGLKINGYPTQKGIYIVGGKKVLTK